MVIRRDQDTRIVPLGEDHGDDVSALFGRAFQDDPLFAHACPNPVDRARWLPWLFRWSTWKGFQFGQTLGTAGRLIGAAVVIGPDGGEFTESDLSHFGYRQGRENVGAAVWDKAVAVVNAAFEPADRELHRVVSEPHWYLDAIAVEPTHQGRGIGGSLLEAVAARAAADDMPIVLLNYQPANLPLYRRHGYSVVCEGDVVGNTLHWWGMSRGPNS